MTLEQLKTRVQGLHKKISNSELSQDMKDQLLMLVEGAQSLSHKYEIEMAKFAGRMEVLDMLKEALTGLEASAAIDALKKNQEQKIAGLDVVTEIGKQLDMIEKIMAVEGEFNNIVEKGWADPDNAAEPATTTDNKQAAPGGPRF